MLIDNGSLFDVLHNYSTSYEKQQMITGMQCKMRKTISR